MVILEKVLVGTLPFDYYDSWSPALSQIEGVLAIIAACIPTLRPFVAALVPSLFDSETPKYGSENLVAGRAFGGSMVAGRRAGLPSAGPNTFVLQTMGHTRTTIRAQRPSESPHRGSEDEVMTLSGIVMKTEVSFEVPAVI